jgi:AcrR family transcriptional regulator
VGEPTPTPKRRGRPPSGGREAILDATLELIRTHGIAKLTSRDVAARAGVSDASVYYHFEDRAGLLGAAFEHGMKPLKFMSTVDPQKTDRATVLREAMRSLEEFFTDSLPVLLAAQSDPELAATLADYIQQNDLGPHLGVESLGNYLRGEQQAGRVNREVDVEAAALLLIDFAFSRVARAQMLHQSEHRLPSRQRALKTLNLLLDP